MSRVESRERDPREAETRDAAETSAHPNRTDACWMVTASVLRTSADNTQEHQNIHAQSDLQDDCWSRQFQDFCSIPRGCRNAQEVVSYRGLELHSYGEGSKVCQTSCLLFRATWNQPSCAHRNAWMAVLADRHHQSAISWPFLNSPACIYTGTCLRSCHARDACNVYEYSGVEKVSAKAVVGAAGRRKREVRTSGASAQRSGHAWLRLQLHPQQLLFAAVARKRPAGPKQRPEQRLRDVRLRRYSYYQEGSTLRRSRRKSSGKAEGESRATARLTHVACRRRPLQMR